MSVEQDLGIGYKVPDIKWKFNPGATIELESEVLVIKPSYSMKFGPVRFNVAKTFVNVIFDSNAAFCNDKDEAVYTEKALIALSEIDKFVTDPSFVELLHYLLGNGRN